MWPPNSPDLYLIQHLWDVLDKQVQSIKSPAQTLQDFRVSAANILESYHRTCLEDTELLLEAQEILQCRHFTSVLITDEFKDSSIFFLF